MIEFCSDQEPFYTTQYGAAYLGDALLYLRQMGRESVDLIITSPPLPPSPPSGILLADFLLK